MIPRALFLRDARPLAYRDLDVAGWPTCDPAAVVYALQEAAQQHGIELTPEVIDKALAVQTALVQESPYIDAFVFEKCAQAFNSAGADFDVFPVDIAPPQLVLAVYVLHKLRPAEAFGEDIRVLLHHLFMRHGLVQWPAEIRPVLKPFDTPVLTSEQRTIQQDYLNDISNYVATYG